MKISIITVFPELHEVFLKTSIIGRAIDKGLLQCNLVRFSDMCAPKERIDEPTVGPGVGMVLKPEVVEKALNTCYEKWGRGYTIFFSPQGVTLTQRILDRVVTRIAGGHAAEQSVNQSCVEERCDTCDHDHIVLVCSRYEGVDERVQAHYADLVLSVGDFVVMGGDLPAQLFLEGLLRLLPGIVGKQESVEHDSFQGAVLDYPSYGLPVAWKGYEIPDILRSGNHAAIEAWRVDQAMKKTVLRRFDWFASSGPTREQVTHAKEKIPNHYVALMHTEVNLKDGRVGTTSIASIDIHDTARACATYAIENFFIATPLVDQQQIVKTFLGFWRSEQGTKYNPSRQHAVSIVRLVDSFADIIAAIEEKEGVRPIIVTTSAKHHAFAQKIDYKSQSIVWAHERPVLFVFGTGQGLSDAILSQADYLLVPVNGLTTYNHLSVRSAVSIILDRWIGLQPDLALLPERKKKTQNLL